MNKMTEMQKSALLEAGNIGSGHAAIALSQLMGQKIMIAIPSIEMFKIFELEKILFKNGKDLLQIFLMVYGDIRGSMIFTLEHQMSLLLCDIVMGQKKGSTKILGDMEMSALKEVGSIISSSYLNAVSEMTGISMVVSTPESNSGNFKMIENILVEKDDGFKNINKLLCIRTEFTQMEMKIEGFLVFVPVRDAIDKIIKSLGV